MSTRTPARPNNNQPKTTAAAPAKFKRHKSLDELRKACEAEGWPLDPSRYDQAGADTVIFDFTVGSIKGRCCYNTFNGEFFGETNKHSWFSSDLTEHENCAFFKKLLDVCLVPFEKEEAR